MTQVIRNLVWVVVYHGHLGESSCDPAEMELREMGVSKIATGRKNESKRSLLAWCVEQEKHKNVSESSASVPSHKTLFKLQYQDEQRVAGVPAFRNDVEISTKMSDNYQLSIPFGVDVPLKVESPIMGSAQVKSLSEIMREKQAAKPLATYMKKT